MIGSTASLCLNVQVMDLLPMMLTATDAKGKILLSNEEMARAYGRSQEELVGSNYMVRNAAMRTPAFTLVYDL